jgi:diguanylate cyclase (GGDEF)-like protein
MPDDLRIAPSSQSVVKTPPRPPRGTFEDGAAHEHAELELKVRQEQLDAVRRLIPPSLLVSYLLGMVMLMATVYTGHTLTGLWWFALCVVVNLLCTAWYKSTRKEINSASQTEKRLTFSWLLSLACGLVWALAAFCSDGYRSEFSMFYLTVLFTITGAAVSYSFSYRAISIAFVSPPLLTAAGCLALLERSESRLWVALAVVLYGLALIGAALRCERVFVEFCRRKYEAKTLAHALHSALENLRQSSLNLAQKINQDSLTGLPNRHGFMQSFSGLQTPRDNALLCLLLLDLDGFKKVNDTYGHLAGDATLAAVGSWLRELLVREFPADTSKLGCARLGGDEFAVLCEVNNAAHADILAQQLIDSFTDNQHLNHRQHLGLSIGLRLSAEPSTVSDLLLAADEAMHAAKQAGRNRIQVYNQALDTVLGIKRDIARDLPEALANKHIALHFQPIIGSRARRTDSFEGLLRWQHPSHGWVNPEIIVLAAAQNGLADSLTRHIVDQACEGLLLFSRQYSDTIRVAINISPREVLQLPVDDIVIEALRRHKLPAQRLELEITEDAALDMDATRDKLERLSCAGIDVAVDDFGIGYSSLGLIRSRFIKRIKIDRSFSSEIARHYDARAVIAAAVSLGKSLNLQVVAEGVESREQLEALLEMGCDLFQGYYFSRALPLPQALEWLKKHN